MVTRIFWIAVNSSIELIKDRVLVGLMFVGVLMIMSGHILADLSQVERTRMVLDVGIGALIIVGVLTTLFAGTNLVDREIRERQVLCILSKPVPRYAWLTGKTLGLIFIMGSMVMILTVFLFLFVWVETRQWMFTLFLGGFFIFLMLLVVAGYTILFSTLTSQFMALFYGLLVVFIGHLVNDLQIYWTSQSMGAQVISRVLYYIIPDLKSFSAWPVVLGQAKIPASILFFNVLYALCYLVIPVTIATLILERREFE